MPTFAPLRPVRATLCATLCLCLSLCLTACQRSESPEGIVATVNGSPVHLSTLQALQDSRTVSLGTNQRPSVESLKKHYGAALSVLIINMLVMQELDRLELSVSDAAVQAAETQVRADYSDEEFEKILTEEYIDLHAWRELTRQQLSIAAFQDKVLRPQITVSLEDIQEYYTKNKAEFVLPDGLTLVQVSGTNKAQVDEARAKAPDFPQPSADLTVQRFNIRRQSVPQEWQKDVQALKVGGSTTVKNRDGFYQFVTLIAVQPEKPVLLKDAYALIHEILLEDSLQSRFSEWVEQAVQKARIRVAEQLRTEMGAGPTNTSGTNAADTNATEAKPAEAKPTGTKPADTKPADAPHENDPPNKAAP